MALIIFVRHGKALNNEKGILNSDIDGFPLVKEGIMATQKIAEQLKQLYVLRLYSSPILRAKQSAEIIGDALELTPIMDDRLKDRFHGEMENKPANDGSWKFEVDWNNTTVESVASIQNRMRSFIDSISGFKGIVVVVTHDGPIKSVFMEIFKFDELTENALKISNSSISVLSTNNGWTPLALNYPKLTEPLIKSITANL